MLRGRNRRTRAVICVVALAVLSLSACGSDTTTTSSSGFKVSTLASSTTDGGTARVAGIRRSSNALITPNPSETTFTGELDFVTDSSTWVGATKQSKGDPQVSHSTQVGGVSYYESPDFSDEDPSEPPPEKPWTRSEAFRSPLGFGSSVANVSSMFSELERWGGQPVEVGTEEVRGVPTTHYRFDLAAPAVPKQLIAMGTFTKPKAGTTEIWVDAQQRLRRLVQSTEDSSDYLMTEYFDFGAPVTIEAPPSDQVMDEDHLTITGDWEQTHRGRAGDVEWTIFRAPDDDGVCLAHEATPAGRYDDIGFPKQRGRSVDTCTSGTMAPEVGVPKIVDAGFDPAAAALANGMALLFGWVDPGTTSVTLHYADGHTTRVVPEHDTFAVVLGADEVVTKVEPDIPGHEISCTFNDESAGIRVPGYRCIDESGLTAPGPVFPGGLPPVPGTAPPGDLPDVG